jgi:ribosomal protein S18 acetylase RimI-like enzyme
VARDPIGVRIEAAASSSTEIVAAVGRLVAQLSSSAQPPGAAQLDALVRSPAVRLLLARDAHENIVGMLTLALFPTPTGVRAWIEDVVVDEDARGRGVGGTLTAAAIEIAQGAGARTVDLTSRPDREAANRLYVKLGFTRRETNVYRYRRPAADVTV